MSTERTTLPITAPAVARRFARVVVGVDGSALSLEAARQAAALLAADGRLTILGAWTLQPPTIVSEVVAYGEDADAIEQLAEHAVTRAGDSLSVPTTTKVVCGLAWQELIRQATRDEAGLIAVGSHGRGRLHGILMGSTATELVHKAPCSVLIARPASGGVPRKIVVGVDGSPQSAGACAVATDLAERFGSELWPVVAHGGKGVDKASAIEIVGRWHEDLPDDPVHALVAASADADLVVVGSRGLHGLRALGSVSERVAHEARCSTLVVRPPSHD
jgi:nucleotide-binding universal stress UspA family protein